MNINLASFIDRLPEVTTNTAPDMAKTATQLQQSNKHQVGAINNDFLNHNAVEANIEVIGLHVYSAATIIIVLLVMFALILIWRMCKCKNCNKICHFICVKRCRYRGDEPEDLEASVSYSARGGAQVQNFLMNTDVLSQLANQLAVNTAMAQVQSRSASTASLHPQPQPQAAAEPTAEK